MFYLLDASPSVAPGLTTSYKCNKDGYVTDTGATFAVTCGTDGNFIDPENWPDCR